MTGLAGIFHRARSRRVNVDRTAMTQANASAAAASEPIPAAAILMLSLATFASATSTRICDSMLPHLTREFGVSLGAASDVVMIFTLAYGLSQLFFGPLGDRYGKYFVVACACAACTITTAFCAAAPSFDLLLLGRFLAGATVGAISGSARRACSTGT